MCCPLIPVAKCTFNWHMFNGQATVPIFSDQTILRHSQTYGSLIKTEKFILLAFCIQGTVLGTRDTRIAIVCFNTPFYANPWTPRNKMKIQNFIFQVPVLLSIQTGRGP